MHTSLYASRREKLRYSIMEAGLSGLLVSHAANRYYLSGFELHDPQCNESAGWLLITTRGDDWLFTDPRYHDAALRVWDQDKICINTGVERQNKLGRIKDILSKGRGRCGVEAKSMNLDTYQFLGRELDLQATRGMVESFRLVKDDFEMARMRRSAQVNHEVFARVPEVLVPGRTEAQVAWEIEKLFHELGASELSFSCIVAVGANAALPHAVPGETMIQENSLVLVDIGGRVEDYCSDQTRTFWVGDKPSDRFLKTRDMVQEAQDKAIKAMRSGMPVSEVYTVALASFAEHGLENRFTHALGHGIGLETHEPPSMGPHGSTTLKPGMVVTVEPGLYDSEWGGVRWEYMVEVSEDEIRIL